MVYTDYHLVVRVQFTWELVVMRFHVLQHKVISICDDESVSEDFNYSPNMEILGSVKLWTIWCTSRFGYSGSLQEFPPNDARIFHRWLVDGDHFIREAVGDYESAAFVLRTSGFLETSMVTVLMKTRIKKHMAISTVLITGAPGGLAFW